MAANPSAQLFYGVLLGKTPATKADGVSKAVGSLPVEVVFYGESPNEKLALAASKSIVTAHGSPTLLKELVIDAAWKDALVSACKAIKLSKPEIGW